MIKLITSFRTGSRRGYIHVADRGVQSELFPVPLDLKGLRGNRRKAMQRCIDAGATLYTVAHGQGVPGKGYSNSYCYTTYYGYQEG